MAAEGTEPDFISLIGLRTVERSTEYARSEIEIGPRHMNPHGVVHGGVLYAMADTGMGAALTIHLDPSESCATIEVKMVYLAPVRQGIVSCETRLIARSKRLATLESDLRQGDRLVGKVLGTFAVFERRS